MKATVTEVPRAYTEQWLSDFRALPAPERLSIWRRVVSAIRAALGTP